MRTNDNTNRGYPLPHPDNIAVTDVQRIRDSLVSIDSDVTKQELTQTQSQQDFTRFTFETFINLWRPYAHR